MGRVFTCLVVTHANILASLRSTIPRDTASQLKRTLLYCVRPPLFVPLKSDLVILVLRNGQWTTDNEQRGKIQNCELFPSLSIVHCELSISFGLEQQNEQFIKTKSGSRTLTASVYRFAPLNFRRINTRPVSCYAFFKGWLLLSQPPGCLSIYTSFTTERYLGTLANDLGSFPFDDGNLLSPSHSRRL